MKIILKFINWVNKRKLVKLEKKVMEILQNEAAKERVFYLALLLEKELIENWDLSVNLDKNKIMSSFDFSRFSDTVYRVYFFCNDDKYITIENE